MNDLFFFTDYNAIENPQSEKQAFGPALDKENQYLIENRFSLKTDAPSIAVLDGIPFVQQTQDENIVNIILLPISNPSFNFPTIKFFVYRGIQKSSLFDDALIIQEPDDTWKSDNILKTIYDLQSQINADTGNSDQKPTAASVGYHYSLEAEEQFLSDDFYLEKAIFRKDGVQLPLVKAGTQLGKFVGGGTEAGVQIVQDRLGYEPNLGFARALQSIVEVAPLVDDTKENLFKHWHQKEAILTYVDFAAFYGCAAAHKQKIKVYTTGTNTSEKKDAKEIVELFYNKQVVYLDIRNDQNYSFDYYDNFGKKIKVMYTQDDEEIAEEINYYDDWPIIRLNQKKVLESNTSSFEIQLPLKGISGLNYRFFLKSFTHEFLVKQATYTTLTEINSLREFDNFQIRFGDRIKLNSWKVNEDTFGANYFVFKYAVKSNNFGPEPSMSKFLLDGTFSLDIKDLLGDEKLDDGDFRVYTYSAINAPIMFKNDISGDETNEVYTQNIGIAVEKDAVTFFSFADEIGHSTNQTINFPLSLIKKGRYQNSVFLDEFDYNPENKSVGFLEMLPFRVPNGNLKLIKIKENITFWNQFNIKTSEDREFLYYANARPFNENQFRIDPNRFDAITISKQEYETLVSIQEKIRKGVDGYEENGFRFYLDIHTFRSENPNADGYVLSSNYLGLKGIAISSSPESIGPIYYDLLKENTEDFSLTGLITKN